MARRVSSPRLIGRDREVADLSTAIARGGMVLVSGDAGIGKTRLVREAVDRHPQGGHWPWSVAVSSSVMRRSRSRR